MHSIKELFHRKEQNTGLFITMLVAAIAGFIAAFVLTVDKFRLLENPDTVLSCSINIVLNCANVMKTPQSSVFGFPNSLLGLIGYSVIITMAISYLSGARMKRWYWQTAQVFFILGAIFSYWLFFQSVYVIQVLCPWCLLVTFVTTILLGAITRYNIVENNFALKKKVHTSLNKYVANGLLNLVVATWIVILIALVLIKFGDGLFG